MPKYLRSLGYWIFLVGHWILHLGSLAGAYPAQRYGRDAKVGGDVVLRNALHNQLAICMLQKISIALLRRVQQEGLEAFHGAAVHRFGDQTAKSLEFGVKPVQARQDVLVKVQERAILQGLDGHVAGLAAEHAFVVAGKLVLEVKEGGFFLPVYEMVLP